MAYYPQITKHAVKQEKKKKRNEMKQEKSQWIKAETEMKQMIQ